MDFANIQGWEKLPLFRLLIVIPSEITVKSKSLSTTALIEVTLAMRNPKEQNNPLDIGNIIYALL